MKNRLLFSSSFLSGVAIILILTISLYQFDILKLNQKVDFETPNTDATIISDNNEETSSASKVISFFSFILNFSKSPN